MLQDVTEFLGNRKIDYDRGVTIRTAKDTGVEVFMYKDEPGVFLSKHATKVGESLAKAAGFDTDRLLRERAVRQQVSAFEAQARAELLAQNAGSKIVLERAGFKILDLGMGRHQVLSPDGEVLNRDMLPLELAQQLIEQLTPEVTEPTV